MQHELRDTGAELLHFAVACVAHVAFNLCCDPCCVQFVLHFVCACASCVAVPSFLAWHVAAWWAAKWNTVGTQWFWAWCVPPEHTTQVWKIKHWFARPC